MKIRKVMSTIGCLFVLIKLNAQYENVWVFGKGQYGDTVITSEYGTGCGLDFNQGQPIPIRAIFNEGKSYMRGYSRFGEGNASVCNSRGQLLFYTDGTTVQDSNGNIMFNGRDLTNVPPFLGTIAPTSSTSQGALIIPFPDNPDRFYILSLTSAELGEYGGRLYYSVVNLELNNGFGAIEQKQTLIDSNLTEVMTGVVGNRCNVWILVYSFSEEAYKAYEVTSSGINLTPVVSKTGLRFAPAERFGAIAASPDGKKVALARTNLSGAAYIGLELSDFDGSTGLITKTEVLDSVRGYSSVCFSPNNTRLYATQYLNGYDIVQFDLLTPEPVLTKKNIGKTTFCHLKLGPNGKIYFQSLKKEGANMCLGSIDFPDLLAPLCGYSEKTIVLLENTVMHSGLPNVIPMIKKDTSITKQQILGACFANVTQPFLKSLNDTSGWDYLWNDGTPGTSRKADTPGIYWVTYYTPPCNYHVDTFHVSFPNGVLPDIHIQNACKNTANGKVWATTYPGDTVTYHYYWQNNRGDTLSLIDTLQNVPSGNYTLRVSTAQCDTVLLFFIPEEEHHVSFLSDSIVCQGAELHFTNTSDNSFTQFLWNFDDGEKSQSRNPVHVYDQAGLYQVTLVGKGEVCTDTAYRTVEVDFLRSVIFKTEPDSICTGESISFYPKTDSTALGQHWIFGDGEEMTSFNEEKVQHAYAVPGIVQVTLTSHFRACPTDTFSNTVFIYDLPIINLGSDSSLCLQSAPVYLKNLAAATPGNFHYLWSTGDTTESIKVIHSGIYSLRISSDPLGCSNTESITINKDCYIDIPNAFTPNGDGWNDYFFPRQLLSRNITQFRLQIFNRWGQVVFESTNPDGRGWDGTLNGMDQLQGVYIYIIDVETAGGNPEQYKGNVTLVR